MSPVRSSITISSAHGRSYANSSEKGAVDSRSTTHGKRENVYRRASTALVAIAIGVLVSLTVTLDAGPGSSQAEPDAGPGGRRWMPMPFFPPGAAVIFLVGDPLRGGGYMYVRFPVAYAPPLHSHTATERIYVNRGTLLLERPKNESVRKHVGDYFVVKADTVHTTMCAGPEDCFCYVSIDRALDVIPFRHDHPF